MTYLENHLIENAETIAVLRGYTDLPNGLQQLDKLNRKLQHEWQEFFEARDTKTLVHQYHEAADILYYAAQLSEQMWRCKHRILHFFDDTFKVITEVYGLDARTLTESTLGKYAMRSASKDSKDEEKELAMIRVKMVENG